MGFEGPNLLTAWLSGGGRSILGREEQGERMLLALEARSEAVGWKQGKEAYCVDVKSERVESESQCLNLSASLAYCCI